MSDAAGWFSWGADVADSQGFSGAEIEKLRKALSAGDSIDSPGVVPGDGFALRVESLDATMRSLVHSQDDIVAFRAWPKKKASQVIQEFNQLVSVGAEGNSYIAEGDLPGEDNTTYARRYVRMKLLGVTKRVTHLMGVVKDVPLPEGISAAEAKIGTMKLLRDIELGIWTADSTLSPLQYDGFEAMFIRDVAGLSLGSASDRGTTAWFHNLDTALTANIAYDMRYNPLGQDAATELARNVRKDPNYGKVTDIFYGFDTHIDFSRQFYPTERANGLVHEGKAGIVVDSWLAPTGKVALNPATFIRESDVVGAPNGPVAKRPATPTLGAPAAAPIVVGTDPGTGFHGTVQTRTAPAAVDGAGNYIYRATAHNRYGRSAAGTSAAVAVVVGDKVTFTITDGSAPGVTEWYDIYRTFPGKAAATAKYIFSIKRSGPTTTVVDYNHFLPGTSKAYFVQRNIEAMGWYSLLPLMKLPLATIDTSIRFMLLTYGAPALFAPRKHGLMLNIGPLA